MSGPVPEGSPRGAELAVQAAVVEGAGSRARDSAGSRVRGEPSLTRQPGAVSEGAVGVPSLPWQAGRLV